MQLRKIWTIANGYAWEAAWCLDIQEQANEYQLLVRIIFDARKMVIKVAITWQHKGDYFVHDTRCRKDAIKTQILQLLCQMQILKHIGNLRQMLDFTTTYKVRGARCWGSRDKTVWGMMAVTVYNHVMLLDCGCVPKSTVSNLKICYLLCIQCIGITVQCCAAHTSRTFPKIHFFTQICFGKFSI